MKFVFRTLLAASAAATSCSAFAQVERQPQTAEATDAETEFRDPPPSARPRVWWHWMNGNVTVNGIAKDLGWMKRAGIGGVQNFDASLQTPQIVPNRLVYMSPEWKGAFRFAVSEADRLGLEFGIASSPGWSETGGPWVPPEDGIKKLVWSETEAVGGKPFIGRLAPPPQVSGPYQTIAASVGVDPLMGGVDTPLPKYYRDVAVLAVPWTTPDMDLPVAITESGGHLIDNRNILDGDLQTAVSITPSGGSQPTLTLTYGKPQTVRSATIYLPGSASIFGAHFLPKLEASDDGIKWREIASLPLSGVPTTVAFSAVTAQKFRLRLDHPQGAGISFSPPAPGADMSVMASLLGGGAAQPSITVAEFRLSSEDRVDRSEAKAAFTIEIDYYALSESVPDVAGAKLNDVVDLTSRLRADGGLDWTPPAGRWRIIRFGYSLTGSRNRPATPEATGLEVDKLDGAAVRKYLEHYIETYRQAGFPGSDAPQGSRALVADSIQVGAANWTPLMIAQFKRLRGYDPTPWLPALAGIIINTRSETDRFLYDFRRTLADLISTEHYGTIHEVARANNLTVYGEALESARAVFGDDMAMRQFADVPMGAMWTFPRDRGPNFAHVADLKGAASAAHIYGQNLVAAESLTAMLSPWAFGPADLKRIIDLAFVTGVNRPIIHTSVHAPTDDHLPGLSLSIFGQHFNRHESWAELARPWTDYIARNSWMLEQGRNVADVAYFYGEEAPLVALYGRGPVPDAPTHYGYDFVNSTALFDALSVEGNDLVSRGGARFRALYLGGTSRRMTLATLRKLAALVEAGATVIGRRPLDDPGLGGDTNEWNGIVAKLWPGTLQTNVGKGRVLETNDIEAALLTIGVPHDFRVTGSNEDSQIAFLHRKLTNGDSYFIVNLSGRDQIIDAHFRVAGKTPELWRAEDGSITPLSYRSEGGITTVPLRLRPDEAVHVVFRKATNQSALAIAEPAVREIARINGPWEIHFQTGRGAPTKAIFNDLAPLDENADRGIKYFSGVATYVTSFTLPAGVKRNRSIWLDLGEAREVADVTVNGRDAGTAWHAPYRVQIGPHLKPGRNTIRIRVANLWVNRLIGDQQPNAEKITWTASPTYTAGAPLRRSGLIGPVRILGQ